MCHEEPATDVLGEPAMKASLGATSTRSHVSIPYISAEHRYARYNFGAQFPIQQGLATLLMVDVLFAISKSN